MAPASIRGVSLRLVRRRLRLREQSHRLSRRVTMNGSLVGIGWRSGRLWRAVAGRWRYDVTGA